MNFLIRVFSPVSLFISLIFLTYIFYKSEIYLDGLQRFYYFKYYIVFISLTFFSIITFFFNKKIKEYLIISAISLIATLYLFEGYIMVKNNLNLMQIKKKKYYEKVSGNIYDTRSKLEIYKDLKKIDNTITLAVPPSIYPPQEENKVFPLSGVSNSKTIHCNENGYFSIYQSDRYGFNNPDSEWDRKDIEYLTAGDSFTHGSCVNRPNDIASVLRHLSNKGALNIGYSGNGPLMEYASLREYLNPNVKKVLWIYFEGNDLTNLRKELSNKVLRKYLDNLKFKQNLKLKQKEINDLASSRIFEEKDSLNTDKQFNEFLKIYNLRSLLIHPKQQRPQKEFKQVLELAKNLTKKNKSNLYFVYLPEISRYKSSEFDNSNYLKIREIINDLNIDFIDIPAEVFGKKKNPLDFFFFEQEHHYTVEGYKKIAETIFRLTNI